ncbi:MAG: hypothetical protein WDM90_15370 [Ferruginibacter sp.]
MAQGSVLDVRGYDPANPYSIKPDEDIVSIAAEDETEYKTIPQMEKGIGKIKSKWKKQRRI